MQFLGGISGGIVFCKREKRVPWVLCQSGALQSGLYLLLKRDITKVKYIKGQEGSGNVSPGEWAQELKM